MIRSKTTEREDKSKKAVQEKKKKKNIDTPVILLGVHKNCKAKKKKDDEFPFFFSVCAGVPFIEEHAVKSPPINAHTQRS